MKKNISNLLVSTILIFSIFFTSNTQAQEKEKVSHFLNSCLYGMTTGALLGVASLTFVNDPAGSMNNIARGASLGLYAGIATGFYYMDQDSPNVTFAPNIINNKMDGGQFLITLNPF
jgi:hypothetical protein